MVPNQHQLRTYQINAISCTMLNANVKKKP